MMRTDKNLLYVAVAVAIISTVSPAAADDFFAGKRITITHFGGAGNTYDAYSRLLTRHLGRYIPGNPSFVVVSQPGAGGLTQVNYAARIAPQDGTLISMISDGMVMYEASGRPGVQESLGKFKWLGALSKSNQVTITWHTSNIRTLEDAKKREVRLGGSGVAAMSTVLPQLYNSLVGTRFVTVQGYKGAPDQNLALERGELDGRGVASWTSYKNMMPQEIRDGKVHVIVQVGLEREPDLPNAPLLIELAGTDPQNIAVTTFVSKALMLTRTVVAPPGVPDDRVAILRKALADVVNDKAFLAEVDKLVLDIGFRPGAEVQALVADVLASPKDVVERMKIMMKF
jgi:tripartite-type tricarboxylate transporter receptor subunit TctC